MHVSFSVSLWSFSISFRCLYGLFQSFSLFIATPHVLFIATPHSLWNEFLFEIMLHKYILYTYSIMNNINNRPSDLTDRSPARNTCKHLQGGNWRPQASKRLKPAPATGFVRNYIINFKFIIAHFHWLITYLFIIWRHLDNLHHR